MRDYFRLNSIDLGEDQSDSQALTSYEKLDLNVLFMKNVEKSTFFHSIKNA